MSGSVKQAARPDQRVERWREHRVERRAALVQAALVAYEKHGPDANLTQIAAVAGMPKPRIYRHFNDKADLVASVGDYLRDRIVESLSTQLTAGITVREQVEQSLAAYVALVAEHPNAMVMLSMAPPARPGAGGPLTESGRVIAQLISRTTVADLTRMQVPTDAVEPLTHALVGAVLGATDWWLRQPVDQRPPAAFLVDQLSTVLIGAGDAALRAVGVVLDE